MTALALVVTGAGVGYAFLYGHLTPAARVLVAVYLVIALATVLERTTDRGAWLLGLLALLAAPVLLAVGADFAPAEKRVGLLVLLYLYSAGAAGGLVLELLQDKKYAVELPSTRLPPDNTPASTASPEIQRTGPMWNLGFLSRMVIGGLSGVALVPLLSEVGNANGLGPLEPAALGWALVAGSTAPAVWSRLAGMVGDRLSQSETNKDKDVASGQMRSGHGVG
jgi:hypothetical protein